MHGYGGATANHFGQANHMASWGMHALTLQLLNDSEWGTNGRTLARLVRFFSNPPPELKARIDPDKIILVGYSFGGISVSVALALKASVKGAILLDPAAVRDAIAEWLPLITAPVMVIGADQNVAQATHRDHYFRNLGGAVIEVSVKGAAHEDAQSIADAGLTTKAFQDTFVSTLTAAAFGLSSTGKLDYAWTSIEGALSSGTLLGARRK
jgi:pimeloyl-ACP methyl ester carboxylesterase